MGLASRLTPWLAAPLVAACAQLQGVDSYENVPCLDDCPSTPDQALAGADGGSKPSIGPGGTTWAFRRAIALTSDATSALAAEPVLVVVPATFASARARSNGDDLRFSTTSTHGDDLDYFVERWSPGAESLVWVRVPTVPVGASTIFMFYGNGSANVASNFAATFPRARRTAGGGAGSFVATGDIDVDWFELGAGDTLTLPQAAPLRITARRVILDGIVEGTGRGFPGGPIPNNPGSGPGGGHVSNPIDTEGSGGGAYGGVGGRGGEDVALAGGTAGVPYGTATSDDIEMGSGGGATSFVIGGAGGGALEVFGWVTTARGILRVDGMAGGGGFDRNAGGGAGGGILLASSRLDLTGATLTANGGGGGMCAAPAPDGGGGGGGGRIKLRRRANGSFSPPGRMAVDLGSGGRGGGTTAPGVDGAVGTTHVDPASTIVKGVDATLGDEIAN